MLTRRQRGPDWACHLSVPIRNLDLITAVHDRSDGGDARVSHPDGAVTGDGRGWRRHDTDVDGDDAPVRLGLDEDHDEMRDDTAKTMTSVATGGASWSGGWR